MTSLKSSKIVFVLVGSNAVGILSPHLLRAEAVGGKK